jgi:hypothetical protein
MPKIKKADLQAAADAGRFNRKDRSAFPLRMTPEQWDAVNSNRHIAKARSLNAYIVDRLTASDSTAGRMRDEDTDYVPTAFDPARSGGYKKGAVRTDTIAGRQK